jgi:hypothetical protein
MRGAKAINPQPPTSGRMVEPAAPSPREVQLQLLAADVSGRQRWECGGGKVSALMLQCSGGPESASPWP